MSRKLAALKKELNQLQKATESTSKGTDDCFDDSLVGPVTDEYGQPILDPVRLMALGYSV
jgi:hypothetical protein